jgi:hypothetical protein
VRCSGCAIGRTTNTFLEGARMAMKKKAKKTAKKTKKTKRKSKR